MGKVKGIPVHEMDDWLSGIYMKPAGKEKTALTSYVISTPHRHDFYYCVLVDKGTLSIEVDFQKIELTDRTLFLSYPGQVHQINAVAIKSGWFLAFDPSILDQELRDVFDQCLSEVILLPLSAEQSSRHGLFLSQVYNIYGEPSQLYHKNMLQSMIIAFAYQVASSYMSLERSHLIKHSHRSVDITKRFMQLVRHNYLTIKKPSDYAATMHISTTYLNDTVKSVTGFPATYFIQQELIREAQRLLFHSEISVKEIAYALGYEDEKYFSRLFSKVAGVAPGVFRKGGKD